MSSIIQPASVGAYEVIQNWTEITGAPSAIDIDGIFGGVSQAKIEFEKFNSNDEISLLISDNGTFLTSDYSWSLIDEIGNEASNGSGAEYRLFDGSFTNARLQGYILLSGLNTDTPAIQSHISTTTKSHIGVGYNFQTGFSSFEGIRLKKLNGTSFPGGGWYRVLKTRSL